jgi:hypothetical protein
VDRRGHRCFMYRRRGALALVLRRDLPSRRGRANQSQFAARKHPNAELTGPTPWPKFIRG